MKDVNEALLKDLIYNEKKKSWKKRRNGEFMSNNNQFKPYVPAEKVTPELTFTSIFMGVLNG